MHEPVYYVCKYTPLELLAGFGLPFQRLDPAPADFSCADSCAHPNLCGYGKAVLEEVIGKGIRRLLLVDCCDVCRRIYDILKDRGRMEFLFLFSLPHRNGEAECALVEKELSRLSRALSELTRSNGDEDSVMAAWRQACTEPSEEAEKAAHILLTGAHGGEKLLNMISRHTSLPVVNRTCTGNRRLPPFDARTDISIATGYARALLNQSHPCMRMQFGDKAVADKAAGIICHTVKFCDYYGFQYRLLKKNAQAPLLKIETDCTTQSSGQLRTRIEAFAETLEGVETMEQETVRDREYVAGIDSGSASTDAVILNRKKEIVSSAILPTGSGAAAGAERALTEALRNARLSRDQIGRIVTTGYGRGNIRQGDRSVTEITCHARGAHFLNPQVRTVIDIGGQDSKVIRVDEAGCVESFVMNDKCAAGTGRFLEMMARTMDLTLAEMSRLGLRWKKEVDISSMCTVFAESEVVSLIAENAPPADIIHGLNTAIAVKTASLVRRANGIPLFMMTGGVAQNEGVVRALGEKLNAEVFIHPQSQLCGALGAALFALD